MATIYTIAHPFTNEIVYVGCTRSFNGRIRAHLNTKSDSEISKWVRNLANNYILPKIEAIDVVDWDEAMYYEEYWIQQIQTWGFKLFNKHKTIGIKTPSIGYIKKERQASPTKRYIKKTPEQWAEEREKRKLLKQRGKPIKINKWNLSSFEIGKQYEVELNKKLSFKEMFRTYAIDFGLKRHLTYVVNEDKIVFTVNDGERVYLPDYGRTKGGAKRYKPLLPRVAKPKIERPKRKVYFFEQVKIGDTIMIDILKWDSFKNALMQFNRLHKTNICYFYKPNEDLTKVVITFKHPDDNSIKNIPISQRLARPKKYITA